MAVWPFITFTSLPYWAIGLCFLVYVHGVDFIPERLCGTLFSQNNFEGDSFNLNDFDVSADIRRDYRASLSGWLNTSSIRVELECSMYVCAEKHFQGTCHILNENITQPIPRILQVGSANCTCSRECNCEDVILSSDEYVRAYLKGGCQICDTPYLDMDSWERRDFRISEKLQTFKIGRGCNLTLYSDTEYKGVASFYNEEVIENNFKTHGSYQISCDDRAFTPPTTKRQSILDPPKISLPETSQGLLQLVSSNDVMAKHPGIQAALKSLQSGRSWKSAYILLLGTPSPNMFLGGQRCRIAIDQKISECRVSLPIDKLGIANSEIRIIYYDASYGLPETAEDDFVLMASLDNYLSNQEELKHAKPNAVVLYMGSSGDENEKRFRLQRQLRILNGLRARVIDESYSNIIFYIHIEFYVDSQSVDTIVADFETDINMNFTIPKPFVVLTHGNFDYYEHYRIKYVNGFAKMFNGEYWPLNLIERLRVICSASGDALGKAIFKENFVEIGIPRKVRLEKSQLLPRNHSLVQHYQLCSSNHSIPCSFNPISKPEPLTTDNIVEQTTSSTFLDRTDECNCNAVRDRVGELEQKLVEQSLISENLNSKIQQLVTQRLEIDLPKNVMSSEEVMTEVRKLEDALVTQKNSRDAELEQLRAELMDDIKNQFNTLFGNHDVA